MSLGNRWRERAKAIAGTNYQQLYQLRRELAYLDNCKKVLDIGCGDGEFISLSPDRIEGLDISEQTVKNCLSKGLRATLGSATKFPFKTGSFDGVHCSHLIEHLYPNDAYKMLQEVGRVLKKRGVFVLSTPLLWKGFFEDFTHLKPYYPSAIERYLVYEGEQHTMNSYPYRFERVDLFYRYRPLPLPTRNGRLAANWLYQYNIHTFTRDAYTLILRKVS